MQIKPHNNLSGFLQEELIRKVNEEAEIEYKREPAELPKYERPQIIENSAGMYNLISNILKGLRP